MGGGRRSLKPSNVKRAKLAIKAGQYRKSIQALTSERLGPATESTLGEMLAKHPQSPQPPLPLFPPPAPILVNVQSVFKALQSFPSDSAPGPSLLRANHVREAVRCPTASCGQRAPKGNYSYCEPPGRRRGSSRSCILPLWRYLTCCEEEEWWSQTYCRW